MGWWRWLGRSMDVWGIAISTCLQDGPFFAIRIYLMVHHHVVSYMMIFFTCKNTLASSFVHLTPALSHHLPVSFDKHCQDSDASDADIIDEH